ncbi:hypothetical protein DPMN_030181 [Dreissena polymorpha]|uniref:Uncharacterized protein n=1 Tax=Dreissena polymorpha TaxID=45954 RepID=A0A9D4M255_DREPO|nr:hypothetical protein DPMN_030181 [Dreissena polymorpha]
MVANNSDRLGLTIDRGESNVLNVNAPNDIAIKVQGDALEEVDGFTYFVSILITVEGRM